MQLKRQMMTSLAWRSVMLIVFTLNESLVASNEAIEDGQLSQTLESLRLILDFFKREHISVNLDAVIGIRIVEGQLKILLQRIEGNRDAWPIDAFTLLEIKELQALAGEVSDLAIPYVNKSDPPYYQRIGPIIQKGFWELNFPSRDFSLSEKVWPVKDGEVMLEDDSDNCLTEFFGTGLYEKQSCKISSNCWELMTQPGYNRYSLSHEVFYLQIGKMAGCSEQMEWQRLFHRQPELDKLASGFCANMMIEAMSIADDKYPELRQDLFMEQAGLCGMLGYRQFFSSDWLEAILSWQNPDLGCYQGVAIKESEVEYRHQAGPFTGHRSKREERPLAHGCLSHRTTVAAAALANYIRYILEWQAVNRGAAQILEDSFAN